MEEQQRQRSHNAAQTYIQSIILLAILITCLLPMVLVLTMLQLTNQLDPSDLLPLPLYYIQMGTLFLIVLWIHLYRQANQLSLAEI